MSNIEKRADFSFIRYANCWEDADILMKALNISEGDRCLSIASSGDNSLSMLAYNPAKVVAVDLNRTQLASLELRIAAIKNLDYDDVLKLLGITAFSGRLNLYKKIKKELSPESLHFFDANPGVVDTGIVYNGKFENYFKIFRTKMMPFITSRKNISEFLRIENIDEQERFFERKFNNWRFRLLFKIFFSRYMMGKLGRDPEFFKYVEGGIANSIFKRTKYAFTKIHAFSNPYLHFIMKGYFNPEFLPHYLRRENYEKIRINIDNIEPFYGNVKDALTSYSDVKFSKYNLSDIFEYMNNDEFISHLELIAEKGTMGNRVAFWNMMADREIPENMDSFRYNSELSEKLFSEDKAFFYKRFIVCETDSK